MTYGTNIEPNNREAMLYGHDMASYSLYQSVISKGDAFPKKVKEATCRVSVPIIRNGVESFINVYLTGKNMPKK